MGMVRRRTRRRTAMVVGGAAYAAGQAKGRTAGGRPGVRRSAAGAPASRRAHRAATRWRRGQPSWPSCTTAGSLTDEEFAAAKAKALGI